MRNAEHNVNEIFPNRWSPRAMSGEGMTKEELFQLFEAARWAPSSYNGQPWRFIYAHRDTPQWEKIFGLLGEFNQTWCKNAAVVCVVVSQNNFEYNGKPNQTHSFDTGSAWENLALQGSLSGLVVHGMAGFDYDRAKKELGVPDDYTVEAMLVVGKPGKKEDLPTELEEKEEMSDRKKVEEFAFEGEFRQ